MAGRVWKRWASGLNPASDLLSGEQLGNKERMAGNHIDIYV